MRTMQRTDGDEEVPMLSSSDEETRTSFVKPVLAMLFAASLVLLGTLYVVSPMRLHGIWRSPPKR